MRVLATLQDTEYPKKGKDHIRLIARGVVLNEEGKVAIHHIYRDDIFGKQWYYETPGGGVDEGETPEEGLLRECEEEIGCHIEILAEIGEIDDEYRLISRQNRNLFYLCRIKQKAQKHFESEGDAMIMETLYVPIDQAISLYESMEDHGVSGLVKRRELPILRIAKDLIKEKGLS